MSHPKSSTRAISDLHEAYVAELIGGKISANSGAGAKKGDVYNDAYAVECKASKKRFFTVTAGLLNKAWFDARTRDKAAAMAFTAYKGRISTPGSLRVIWPSFLIPATLTRREKGKKFGAVTMLRSQRFHLFPEVAYYDAFRGQILGFDTAIGVPKLWRLIDPDQMRILGRVRPSFVE